MTLSSQSALQSFDSIVQSSVKAFQQAFGEQGIVFEVDIDAGSMVESVPKSVAEALGELLRDAGDAMPEGGSLVITGVDFPTHIELEVADSRETSLMSRLEVARYDRQRFPKCRELELGIETLNCPQGGLARMIRIDKQLQDEVVNRAA